MEGTSFFRRVVALLCLCFSLCGSQLPINAPPNLKLIKDWPKYSRFGQVSGVSVDISGNVFVFHRGDRVWDAHSFFPNDIFARQNEGPIVNDTIIVLNADSGSKICGTGRKLFYLPHGLTVDHENNVWVTDVALHQVFKFPPLQLSSNKSDLAQPLLILGTALEPGNDVKHFCKPSDVAVDSLTGDFFVSDGYCNSRIIKYDKTGKMILEWGRNLVHRVGPYTLFVPHALALAESKNTLFVADRENMRIVAYHSNNGTFLNEYGKDMRSQIYSVAYSKGKDGLLYAVSTPASPPTPLAPGIGSVYNISSGQSVARFAPPGNLRSPHDVAVSPDGRFCYVVELNPYTVWKFSTEDSVSTSVESAAKPKQEVKVSNVPPSGAASGEPSEPKPSVLKPEKDEPEAENGMPFELKDDYFIGGTPLAVILVISIIVISLMIFMFHVYKKKAGYRGFEMRELILDEDEEDGIRLT